MSLAMTKTEREAFLAEAHVGVLGAPEEGRAPMLAPVWYSYQPGGAVRVITGPRSRKARLVAASGRLSLCVQTETAPYKYVTVEGPVTSTTEVDADERRTMAHRYLGAELGDMYVEATRADAQGDVVIEVMPEHWRTTDYGKQFG